MGTERFQGQTEVISADGFPCFHKDPDFGWVAKWQAAKDGTIFTFISRQLSFKDSLMMWTMIWCVNCHQKQVIHLTLLQDQRNLHMAWRMPPDVGGTSLTRHCLVLALFPRRLIDAVVFCTPYSRVSEPGNKITFHSGTIQAMPWRNRVSRQRWMLRYKKCWILLQEVQLQENPW